MFQHLKLLAHKDLQESSLNNLGKINIVCGKNSSGKSTLLAAINNADTRRIGLKLTGEELGIDKIAVDRLFSASQTNYRFASVNQPHIVDAWQKILRDTSQSKAVWYSGEEMKFTQHTKQAVAGEYVLRPYSLHELALMEAYKDLFKDDASTVLISPKRTLELISSIRNDAAVLPHGYGMLPHLFHAKNQNVNAENRKMYRKLSEVFTEITSGARFDITSDTGNNASLEFAQGDEYVPAESVGLGLQELLVILFFAVSPQYQVILLEEPESHLHPEWQRRLLSYLRNETDKQYFISTHSNIFLDAGLVDRVFYTTFTDKIVVEDATSRANILSDLGYAVTDNLVSDLVILVEGPGDVQVIKEFLIKMELWEKYNIKLWPLGGDIMAQLDLSVFSERNNILALVDNDKGSRDIREEFIANCEELNIPATRLGRYAIENYFSLRAIQTVYSQDGLNVPESVTELKPDERVDKQLGFSIKGKNRQIAQEMTLKEVEDTGDLFAFLDSVRQQCEKQSAVAS